MIGAGKNCTCLTSFDSMTRSISQDPAPILSNSVSTAFGNTRFSTTSAPSSY